MCVTVCRRFNMRANGWLPVRVSKWCVTFELQQLPGARVCELQLRGVQAQARGHGQHFGRGVQAVAQHGVAQMHHVNPQLV